MTPYDESRRNFLRMVVRGVLLGASVVGIGSLVARRGREDCTGGGICRGCGAFSECGLPAALSAREAQRREGR